MKPFFHSLKTMISAAAFSLLLSPTLYAGAAFELPSETSTFMEDYCYTCHDEDTQKGDVQLDHLSTLPLETRLDLLNRMQEQVYFGEMPPAKKKQPSEAARSALLGWISKELNQQNASKLEDKLRKPEYGNYIDHDKLFSGEYASLKPYTPNRRWLISEFIFDAKMNAILRHNPHQTIDGKREYVIGDNNRRVNLTNPFLLHEFRRSLLRHHHLKRRPPADHDHQREGGGQLHDHAPHARQELPARGQCNHGLGNRTRGDPGLPRKISLHVYRTSTHGHLR